MADNDIDPAASTQMFRAFVDTPEPRTPAATGTDGGSRTGVIAAVVIAAVVVVAAVAWLAFS
ncbi:hypothetical protein [Streptacidiphilus sp. ASG 303]|uniref:hypothetical protein n=1 Tax=Streptomycetaceae TaxID=2062 RepID=UPI001E290C33|nr:hypothetical protein [Streptacidiphilus sp. ASG 303]MCD0482361.1 hypothetical protein [Streptacidiphilus sp. ASG 303]